jgi:bacterioferritin-associated ferredoxin
VSLNFIKARPVILCICQAVTDSQVDSAIREGARSPAEVGQACGAGTDCGSCRGDIARRIEHARDGACHGNCAACPRRSAAVASAA